MKKNTTYLTPLQRIELNQQPNKLAKDKGYLQAIKRNRKPLSLKEFADLGLLKHLRTCPIEGWFLGVKM